MVYARSPCCAPKLLVFSRILFRLCQLCLLLVAAPLGRASATPLSDVAALRSLTREQADESRPMRLRGVVTYYEPARFLAFLQDNTGGTYVSIPWVIVAPADFTPPIRPGLLVEVEGISTGGRFAPALTWQRDPGTISVRVLGEAPIPTPLRPIRGELLEPKFHSQRVEVEAFVREQHLDKNRLTLSLVFGGRRFEAHLPGPWEPASVPKLAGSDIRVRGVFGSIFNEKRELIGVQLLVPSLADLEVLDAGLTRAFAQPTRPAQEIMHFNPGFSERMRLQGTVTFHQPGRGFFLRDVSGAVWVDDPASSGIAPGTLVDAVGFAAVESRAPILRDAVIRLGAAGPPPEPVPVDAGFALDPALHGQLVRVEGLVVDRFAMHSNRNLTLQAGNALFSASFADPTGKLTLPEPGSWVAVSGICQNVLRGANVLTPPLSEAIQSASFHILSRSPSDLTLLMKPRWWTSQRLLYLTAGLAATVAASLAWATTLRRRVAAQSAIIAEKVSSERITEERTRIARELHDTLEQHLAGVAIQLEAAAAQLPEQPGAASDSLTLGAAMLQHSRTEARRSVWDLRSQLLEQNGLLQTLRDLAESMSTEACRVGVEVKGAERRLDSQAEFHLLRITQEALANALKHATPTRINVLLQFDSEGTHLDISDDGCGFDTTKGASGPGAHFGLLGMRERISKLRGTLQISSSPGRGTQIHLHLPSPHEASS